MAKKLDSIVELAAQKTREISANSGNYMAFLTTAAHNFKYDFRDQLLIYAQKPDATACAQIDFWNKHGRYVNRGTRGIALLVDTDRGYKLRYVFDMSDTNSRQGRTIPIWKMEPRYEDTVIEALENSYGEFPDRSGLAACLLETAKVIVEDNFGDYYTELRGVKAGSLLEELDDLSTETWFKGLVESSVAFIMLTRCGIDPMDYFSGEDFAHVYDFDTPETLSILGGAVSDIAEMPLREIATTVLSLYRTEQRENRTFDENSDRQYHDGRTKQERSVEHGTDIPNGGRLPSAQPGSAGGPEGRKIWDAAAQLPSDPQERLLHGDAPQRQAERPSGEDRPAGHGDGGAADGADGAGAGRDGGVEGQRSDEVGGPDEQHPGSGGGSGADGAGLHGRISGPLIAGEELPQAPVDGTSGATGLQNKHHDFNARTDIPYYHEDSEKQELLRISDALNGHRAEIAAFFEAHEGRKERGDFIKGFFDNTYVEKILSNGQRAGYRAWDDVLNLWRGAYLSREKEVFLRWPHVADTIYGMILLDQWLDPEERPLPSEAEQITFIEQAEREKREVFTLPQEAIDYVLCGGSGVSAGKFRIYEQFQKQESKQENIKFLRDEYGIGGRSDAIPGSGYWEDHDGKGITISRDLQDPNGKYKITWAKVEKRIGELIAADRYLNRAEKEQYPAYRADVQRRTERWKIAKEIRSIINDYVDFKTQLGEKDQCDEVLLAKRCADSFGVGEKKCYVLRKKGDFVLPTMRSAMQTIIADNTHLTERCEAMLAALDGPLAAPLEPTYDELNPPLELPKEHRLSLGATVYLGSQEYELLAFDEQTVRLYDPSFPIINKEMARDEFDRQLAENPLNDRLLQVAEDAAPVADAEEPDAEEPLNAPLPVGRIDFLGTNGIVGESVEYTDAEEFMLAIREENRVGAPMRIVLYRDSEGQTIPQDFLADLDPPPQGFQVIDMAQAQLEQTKWLINAYCMEVFEQEADFSDLSHVPLAFSSTSDSAHTVEISADLVSFRLSYLVDGAEATAIQCAGFRDLNELLANLDFDEMVAFTEEEYNKQQTQKKQTEVQQTEDDPFPEIDPAAIRRTLAERGIVDGKVIDPDKLNADPFIQRVMADAEQASARAPQSDKRFSPIETENGYAVWDNIRDEIYVDDEGVSEEFTSRWQAEEYAHQLNQVDTLARYYGEGETILIRQYPNGQYYVQYCYDDQDNTVYATAGGFDTFEQAEAALYTHRPQAKKDPIAAQDLAYRQAAEYWSGDEHLVIFQEPNGTFCNQYGFISGRVTPTTGSFATLEEAEKQLYADRPLAQKVQAQEKPPAHAPADRDEAERRYQVVVYHHLENGMDEKLEYATPEEAEQAARGYLEGTMEPDGFAYEGAAVYDLLEKKWLRVIGDFPTPERPAAKEEQPPPPREDTETAAADRDLIGKEVTLEGRRFLVEKIDEDGRASLRDLTFEGAVGFPIERVEHISAIRRLMGPAEKTAGPEKSAKSTADGHGQGGYEMVEFQNVYDDLRNKLIARGIPAEEIAYIHSANTEAQKKELFGKVRSGQVRVLIGSTQKMGAGTNVQKKLVALHHLDCPWRPSDLQQREGRIVRQGNENDEVDIYTYVTENTFDSYLYQLVEGKQKFIGQIMTSKSPVRSCEDIDETALSYAEIKALCTGNPHIKEKMDLDIDVQRLRLLKANHLSQRYALEDQIIKELPQEIAKYEQYIEGYTSDMARLKENTHPNEDGFSPMEVEGTVYTDKKAAGSAILAACKAMTSPEPVPLGQYRGFAMDLSFESLFREFKITLKGALYYTTALGTDIFGNILRLDNLLESMKERINTCREQLENTRIQLENAKLEVEKPFPQEDELKRKSARLDELNILLNMDKRESEIVDGDVGDEVTAPARGNPDRER